MEIYREPVSKEPIVEVGLTEEQQKGLDESKKIVPEDIVEGKFEEIPEDNKKAVIEDHVADLGEEVTPQEWKERIVGRGRDLVYAGKEDKTGPVYAEEVLRKLEEFNAREAQRANAIVPMIHEKAGLAGDALKPDEVDAFLKNMDAELIDFTEKNLIRGQEITISLLEDRGIPVTEDEFKALKDADKRQLLQDTVTLDEILESLMEEEAENQVTSESQDEKGVDNEDIPNDEQKKKDDFVKRMMLYVVANPNNSFSDFTDAFFLQKDGQYSRGYDSWNVPEMDQDQRSIFDSIKRSISGNADAKYGLISSLMSEVLKHVPDVLSEEDRQEVEKHLNLDDAEERENALKFFSGTHGKFILTKIFQGKAFSTSQNTLVKWMKGEMHGVVPPVEKISLSEDQKDLINSATIHRLLAEIL